MYSCVRDISCFYRNTASINESTPSRKPPKKMGGHQNSGAPYVPDCTSPSPAFRWGAVHLVAWKFRFKGTFLPMRGARNASRTISRPTIGSRIKRYIVQSGWPKVLTPHPHLTVSFSWFLWCVFSLWIFWNGFYTSQPDCKISVFYDPPKHLLISSSVIE